MTNDTTRLFGLAGVVLTSVALDDDDNPMPALVPVDEQARCCPGCGTRSEHPHSWVRTRPRDLPVAGITRCPGPSPSPRSPLPHATLVVDRSASRMHAGHLEFYESAAASGRNHEYGSSSKTRYD